LDLYAALDISAILFQDIAARVLRDIASRFRNPVSTSTSQSADATGKPFRTIAGGRWLGSGSDMTAPAVGFRRSKRLSIAAVEHRPLAAL
jgi:hypothetical protein